MADVEPDRSPDLRLGDVHVVHFCLDRPFAGAVQLLDRHERERAGRFAFDRDRRRFVCAHAWLRLTLGICLNRPPESLHFAANARGKPQLVAPSVNLHFNLSHAGNHAALAMALHQEVGVDIERVRPMEVLELAERFFSRREVEALRKIPPPECVEAFFRCWTRKEAFIKALGEGLAFPLDRFEVSVDDERSSQLLRGCSVVPDALLHWRVVSLPVERPYVAALAGGPSDWNVVTWKATCESLGSERVERTCP